MIERKDKEKIYFFGGRDVFWVWKAYRELIGSLYESLTIGIGRVYNALCMREVESEEKRY